MKKISVILDAVLCILSALLCFGTKYLFHACGPKEDGGWMACHWAEQAVFGIGLVLLVLSLVMTFAFKDGKTKSGIALSLEAIAALALVMPNHLISLCMMNTMRCHAVMKPAVIIISILIILCGMAACILHRKEDTES
jgi:hypothetical protein